MPSAFASPLLFFLLLAAGLPDPDNDTIEGVSCGGHHAAHCGVCSQGHGASWCNGDCVWVKGICKSKIETAKDASSAEPRICPAKHQHRVSCGSHTALNCAGCPQQHGKNWCHGDCRWMRGACISKRASSGQLAANEQNRAAGGRFKDAQKHVRDEFVEYLAEFKGHQRAAAEGAHVDGDFFFNLQHGYFFDKKRCDGSSDDAEFAANLTAESVRQAFFHAWRGYCKFAWGKDELKPLSLVGHNSYGGIGMTILDSLTSLWIMGFRDDFERAAKFVENDLVFGAVDKEVSVFELTIRAIGGLNGAHSLTGRDIFLNRSVELASRLLPAFDTPSRLPWGHWNLKLGEGTTSQYTMLADVGTMQLEWRYLSEQTGDPSFKDAVDGAFQALQSAGAKGLVPFTITPPIKPNPMFVWSKFSFGGNTDSYYEYLLKQWLQSPSEQTFKKMFLEVMRDLPMLVRPKPTGYRRLSHRYAIIEISGAGVPGWTMEHLSCFAPGMIALGLLILPPGELRKEDREMWTALAGGLMLTCVEMWTSTASGLAPESVKVSRTPPHQVTGVTPDAEFSLLRPETVESLFYMYRLTGHTQFQKWGALILEALLANAKVDAGFASVRDVTRMPTTKIDEMHSFVLAETFKYLYLLFSSSDALDLSKFVLNTEGHPLRISARMAHQLEQKHQA